MWKKVAQGDHNAVSRMTLVSQFGKTFHHLAV
jgi:hypothetical protein